MLDNKKIVKTNEEESKQEILDKDPEDSQHGDLQHLEAINAVADKLVEDLRSCCCATCEQCTQALAEYTKNLCILMSGAALRAGKVVRSTADGVSTAVVTPVLRSVDRGLRGPDRNDNFELPKNIAMVAINPLLTFSEIFVKANGDPTWIPLQPALARALQCVDLLLSANKTTFSSAERTKRTVAGISSLIFAGHALLYAFLLTDLIQNESQRNSVSLSRPYQMAQDLQFAAWNSLQWAAASFGGYVMATHGYLFGKELVLNTLPQVLKNILVDIKCDAIQRHLKALSEASTNSEREALQSAFQSRMDENKGLWHFTDVMGRSLEHILSASLLMVTRIARDTAANLTSYKMITGKLGAYRERFSDKLQRVGRIPVENDPQDEQLFPDEEKEPRREVGCCAHTVQKTVGCCFNASAVRQNLSFEYQLPSYNDVLRDARDKTYRFSPVTLYNHGRETRQSNEMVRHYRQAQRCYILNKDHIDPPFGVSDTPRNPEWAKEALQDPKIIAFLQGDPVAAGFPLGLTLPEIAVRFNQLLYAHYHGELPENVIQHREIRSV